MLSIKSTCLTTTLCWEFFQLIVPVYSSIILFIMLGGLAGQYPFSTLMIITQYFLFRSLVTGWLIYHWSSEMKNKMYSNIFNLTLNIFIELGRLCIFSPFIWLIINNNNKDYLVTNYLLPSASSSLVLLNTFSLYI